MTASLRVLGAARTVTGSAYELDLDGTLLLVDCGVFQGEHGAAERNCRAPVDDPSGLAAVLLTHGHLDHVGRLPLLVRGGFAGKVLGHPATLAIAEIVLRDALKIARSDGAGAWSAEDLDATLEAAAKDAIDAMEGAGRAL